MKYYLDKQLLRVDPPGYPHVYTHVVTRCGKVEIWCKSAESAEEGRRDLVRREIRYHDQLQYVYDRMHRRQIFDGYVGNVIKTGNPELLQPPEKHPISDDAAREIYGRFETDAALRAAILAAEDRAKSIKVKELTRI